MLDEIMIPTADGSKTFKKDHIIERLKAFDEREPDKTMTLWATMAKWLYNCQELRPVADK